MTRQLKKETRDTLLFLNLFHQFDFMKNKVVKKINQVNYYILVIEPDVNLTSLHCLIEQVCVEHSTTLNFGEFINNKGDLWNMDKYPVQL